MIYTNDCSQSYLLFSQDILHLTQLAKEFSLNFNNADIFWLCPKEGTTSIQVEQTLDFMRQVHLAPLGEKKLFIITDMSTMTLAAQNKILKTLEEPRTDTVFLLLASNEDRVLATIKSRCIVIHPPQPESGSLYEQELVNQNPDSDKIFMAAKNLLNSKTLDEALVHLPILNAKENFALTMIALHKQSSSLPPQKKYVILSALATIRRNVDANCNSQNAFDLLMMEMFS